LRAKLRQMCTDLSIDVPLPKDPKVDRDLLFAMGLGGLADQNVRTVNDLHGKMTGLRNSLAHFLLTNGMCQERREPEKPHHKPHRLRALRCDALGRPGTKYPYTTVG